MPPLAGFTGNPFRNRDDLVRAVLALILPLGKYRSSSGARVKIRPATGAASDDAAQFQGFAQPLFAVAAFLHHDPSGSDHGLELKNMLRGLEAGVNPSSPEYWGDLTDLDPRMLEMESMSLALLAVPDQVLFFLSDIGRENLVSWLQQINLRQMPTNHWRWSRILVNLALEKVFGIPQSENVVSDLALLDSFHVGEGWSSDGLYEDSRKQAGCHPGSLAIQFSQLLYARFSIGDEERAERYKQQARQFAATYWRYFDTNGMLPHSSHGFSGSHAQGLQYHLVKVRTTVLPWQHSGPLPPSQASISLIQSADQATSKACSSAICAGGQNTRTYSLLMGP